MARAQVGEGFGVGSRVRRKGKQGLEGWHGRRVDRESRLVDLGGEDQRLRPRFWAQRGQETRPKCLNNKQQKSNEEMGSDVPRVGSGNGRPALPLPVPHAGNKGCTVCRRSKNIIKPTRANLLFIMAIFCPF